MTRLFNDPVDFTREMTEGLLAANPSKLAGVDGGVVRTQRADGKVAVVIGGGSGHYPAFAGLVGEGLAAGAAMGNLFASPSSDQIDSVARSAQGGAGILLTFGNYAGDVLNFARAQARLRAEGFECETVLVTDDISSAEPGEREKRRGVAGDLAVFKIASAAADAGYSLAEVVRVAKAANDATRTLGVAFSGCTLPGAATPLFSVPDGRMAVGMGIHGEPGIDETDVPTADELAALLVDSLLAERPAMSGLRVLPILNGLGSVKYEELYVVYRRVSRLLEEVGLVTVDPQVGEFCTSFDMAGLSLTLVWLDDELEELWGAPSAAPAFQRSGRAPAVTVAASTARAHPRLTPAGPTTTEAPATPGSAAAARRLLDAAKAVAKAIDAASDKLGALDAVAGDGDHGIGMQRGTKGALDAAVLLETSGDAGVATWLQRMGDAWANRAGGTSGALWGEMLRAAGSTLGNTDVPSVERIARALAAARDAVVDAGGAKLGDKTMVDALIPFCEEFEARVAAGDDAAAAWHAAAATAHTAAEHTAQLVPHLGRARPHGERSLGTPDPGAVSLALITDVIDQEFTDSKETR
jgi:dihydroxyacetone kinase